MKLLLRNPGDAVYGTIAVAALLAAESVQRETYASTVAAVSITLLLYWLAHAYADLAGQRLRTGGRLTAGSLLRTMAHEAPILMGAAVPLVVLLICWGAGAGLSAGVTAAVWTSAAIIVIMELVAGLRADLSGKALVTQALVGGLLGLMVIALKLLLH